MKFNIFTQPTLLQQIEHELAEAQSELLRAESASNFASAMVTYNRTRVNRLSIARENCIKEGAI